MTEKELLYIDDAICHEKSIIDICKNSLGEIDDENLKAFIENQIDSHKSIKNNLITLMKETINEQ